MNEFDSSPPPPETPRSPDAPPSSGGPVAGSDQPAPNAPEAAGRGVTPDSGFSFPEDFLSSLSTSPTSADSTVKPTDPGDGKQKHQPSGAHSPNRPGSGGGGGGGGHSGHRAGDGHNDFGSGAPDSGDGASTRPAAPDTGSSTLSGANPTDAGGTTDRGSPSRDQATGATANGTRPATDNHPGTPTPVDTAAGVTPTEATANTSVAAPAEAAATATDATATATPSSITPTDTTTPTDAPAPTATDVTANGDGGPELRAQSDRTGSAIPDQPMPAFHPPAPETVESPLPVGDADVPPGDADIAALSIDPTLLPNETSRGDTDGSTAADTFGDTPAPADTTDEPDPDRNRPNSPDETLDSGGDPTLRATRHGSPLTTAAPPAGTSTNAPSADFAGAYLATQSGAHLGSTGELRPAAFLGETADKLRTWGERAADDVTDTARTTVERMTEKVREIQADPLGTAVKGLAHLGTPMPGQLADDIIDAAATAARSADPRVPGDRTSLPEIEPAPRLHSDIVLDEVRQARDLIADPDTPLAAKLILSQSFAAALVAAGLEQYVVNPVMAAPADVVDAGQLYAKAEAHIARGEYDLAARDLHVANAKLEQTANTVVDIATLGEGAAAGAVAKEGRLVNAEVHAAEAAKQAETAAAQELDRQLDDAIKPTPAPRPGTYVGSRGNEAKATLGESTMAFAHGADGWAFLDGPSGAAGHRWNGSGPDGVAFRTAADGRVEVRILDNKAFKASDNVSSATALQKNLDLYDLRDQIADKHFDNVPRIAELRDVISSAADAARVGKPLPDNLTLGVTTFGGNSRNVTDALLEDGIRFRGQDTR